MFRIVSEESAVPVTVASDRSQLLFELLGALIADQPGTVQKLLERFGFMFQSTPTTEELTGLVIDAIAEQHHGFNCELAELILHNSLESGYNSDEEGHYSDFLEAIAGAIGSVGGVISKGLDNKRNKDQAATQTLQTVMAQKQQQVDNQQVQKKKKMKMVIGLLVLMGAILAVVFYVLNKSSKPVPATIQPTP